jgi:hypothetical protein
MEEELEEIEKEMDILKEIISKIEMDLSNESIASNITIVKELSLEHKLNLDKLKNVKYKHDAVFENWLLLSGDI